MKPILSALVFCSLIACNNGTSIEKTTDSTVEVLDSQKYITKDSVTYKADSSTKNIDSTFRVLKDSIRATRKG